MRTANNLRNVYTAVGAVCRQGLFAWKPAAPPKSATDAALQQFSGRSVGLRSRKQRINKRLDFAGQQTIRRNEFVSCQTP